MQRFHVFADDKHPFERNIARWLEHPELEGGQVNSRMLYGMSGEEYEKWQEQFHMNALQDLLLKQKQNQKQK